ncbi:PREDICTED: B3 domain-containing protein Os07g0563300-like [Nelumbo nucifera]|uniref:B3 domain-containing protein Os07g0563300 n=2 Tax=Nelumbo nucifera TaxID=4432 RepID=A0A822XPG7_NELNU|nr:PREDICTED: B3 domain-containing protein Os07g0563300-like [Nelumbo nucifera]DAD20806.1 TPA_asm: hypothetical protein HUJ06_022269 [Nelumbo nucifera]
MSSSSAPAPAAASSKICFNQDCKDAKSERLRKGWRLRNGEYAELCDRCASAFEEGRYCETFHSEAAGWRGCESCGKRVHCGCIVSFHSFLLLDAGGVECIACARKNMIPASTIWPSSFFLPLPLPERLKDLSIKNWSHTSGPSAVAAQWRQPPNLWNTATSQPELHPRLPYEVDRLGAVSAMDKKKSDDPSERLASSSLKLPTSDRLANGNAGIDTLAGLTTFHREEGNLDGSHHSYRHKGENDPADTRKGDTSMNNDIHPSSFVNISLSSSIPKDEPSTPHFGFGAPYVSTSDTNAATKTSGTQSQRQTPPPPLTKQICASPNNGGDSSTESQLRNGRPRGDARGRNQLLPRYWPRITDQELQQISGDKNAVITPLFEKMLSASDAGRIGRLVLPKKCAEAYFPAISQPEGLPLKVQDAKGKEWVFQFRFWPNNNSRMYVLEGVTPCIQSMQLQAGDTVTFSRIDPEGKLVMGFRKASSVPADQDNQTHKSGSGISANGEVKSADPASTWSKVDKSGYIAKDVPGAKASIPSKRKSSTLGSKSKRLRIENEDLIELKLTWEEAQGLLRPPPNHAPSIVVIEGHEFEEYEEAPVLGRPTIFATTNQGDKVQWAQCEDCSKWRKLPFDALLPSRWTCSKNSWDPKRSCNSAQELSMEQLEEIISSGKSTASKRTKAAKQDKDAVEASDGLDTLANLAIMGEGDALPPSAQPTTKHPRHRPGCTCIVCIQPPSGKGPKHKQTCTCNVCLTVKRRFRTLMLRREKRQSEKEAETARKKQQQIHLPKKTTQEDDPPVSSNARNSSPNQKQSENGVSEEDSNRKKPSCSPLKGQIDLNIQPEREDEPPSVSESASMLRMIQDATDMYLRKQRLSSSATRDLNEGGGDGAGAGGDKTDGISHGSNHLEVDADHPITLSMSMSAPTSATG